MLPLLFPGTFFEIPTYFVLYLAAFLGAIMLATRIAHRHKLSPVRAVDFGLFTFLLGFSGARLFHILIEAPAYYWEKPIRIFYFWQGGYVLYGGILGALIGGYFVVKIFKEPFAKWADLAAAPLFLGIGIGRMGCLAAGCCYGNRTDWWWGMVFTNPQSGAPLHVALHPTQMLESLFGFVMCGLFLWVYSKPPKRAGEEMVMAILTYSVFRFSLEYLRGDLDRGVFLDHSFSTSQIISVILAAICLLWLSWPKLTNKTIV